MTKKRINLTKLVKEILERDAPAVQAMTEGIANYSAIARRLYPKVAEKCRNVKFTSLLTAIKRLGNEISEVRESSKKKVMEIIAQSTIKVRTNVSTISVKKSKDTWEVLRELFIKKPYFFHILEGTTFVTIICDIPTAKKFKEMMKEEDILDYRENQTALIISSPKEIIETAGVVAFLYNLLSMNNINIEQEMSCYTETIIIVDDYDINKAFSTINNAIIEARNHLYGSKKT